ncbi:MAG: glycerate kinase [Pseudomonadota bacterium]
MHADSRRTLLLDLYAAACDAVDGRRRVRAQLSGERRDVETRVLAIGKAACTMVLGTLDARGASVVEALVIAPAEAYEAELARHPAVRFLPGEHPVPGEASLASGEAALAFAAGVPAGTQVLVLVSGGASSLVEALAPGLTLDDLRAVNRWGMSSGVDIVQLNAVRSRLSRLKGGRLAAALAHADARALLISDVPGDDPRVIGSGLVAAPPPLPPVRTSRGRPLAPATSGLPPEIDAIVARAGALPEGAALPCTIVGTLDDAMLAVERTATARGYTARRLAGRISGDVERAASVFAHELVLSVEDVVVAGGETTVRLPEKPGRGGRNQHLALAAARLLVGHPDLVVLAAGTDGVDGVTLDAGAIVDAETIARGIEAGLVPEDALARADSGTFLEASGDLLHVGPTGTNVGDVLIGLRKVPDPPPPRGSDPLDTPDEATEPAAESAAGRDGSDAP